MAANPMVEGVVALAAALEVDRPEEILFDDAVVVVRDRVAGCTIAGVTVLDGGRPRTAAITDPDRGRALEEAQYASGRGPSLDASRLLEVVDVGDVVRDLRYPELARAAEAGGIGATLSVPFVVPSGRLAGCFTLYGDGAGAFDAAGRALVELLAAHASGVLVGTEARQRDQREIAQLRDAIESRDLIGQAKGILMVTRKISADDAFDLLRHRSQQDNVKLRELADRVAATGELPESG